MGRKIDIFTDHQWVEPLPILCFLVEHPEGRFLIDTGDTWRNSVPGYLPGWNPFYKQVQIRVAPHEEIGPRMMAMGIDLTDIGTVILTHFHHDHTGGLDHFPHSRIIGPKANRRFTGLRGMMMGCLPQRWRLAEAGTGGDGWPGHRPLPCLACHHTGRPHRAGADARPCGGACLGDLRDDDVTYFLAGDATYSQANQPPGKTTA